MLDRTVAVPAAAGFSLLVMVSLVSATFILLDLPRFVGFLLLLILTLLSTQSVSKVVIVCYCGLGQIGC